MINFGVACNLTVGATGAYMEMQMRVPSSVGDRITTLNFSTSLGELYFLPSALSAARDIDMLEVWKSVGDVIVDRKMTQGDISVTLREGIKEYTGCMKLTPVESKDEYIGIEYNIFSMVNRQNSTFPIPGPPIIGIRREGHKGYPFGSIAISEALDMLWTMVAEHVLAGGQ